MKDEDDVLLGRDNEFLVEQVKACANGKIGFLGSACVVAGLDTDCEELTSEIGRVLRTDVEMEPERDCLDAFSDCTESLLDNAGEDCLIAVCAVEMDDLLSKGELDPL